MTDAQFRELVEAHAGDGITTRRCGDGIALYVHDPASPREPRLYEGRTLEECMELMLRNERNRRK
jgi:hypothetical protein